MRKFLEILAVVTYLVGAYFLGYFLMALALICFTAVTGSFLVGFILAVSAVVYIYTSETFIVGLKKASDAYFIGAGKVTDFICAKTDYIGGFLRSVFNMKKKPAVANNVIDITAMVVA